MRATATVTATAAATTTATSSDNPFSVLSPVSHSKIDSVCFTPYLLQTNSKLLNVNHKEYQAAIIKEYN